MGLDMAFRVLTSQLHRREPRGDEVRNLKHSKAAVHVRCKRELGVGYSTLSSSAAVPFTKSRVPSVNSIPSSPDLWRQTTLTRLFASNLVNCSASPSSCSLVSVIASRIVLFPSSRRRGLVAAL